MSASSSIARCFGSGSPVLVAGGEAGPMFVAAPAQDIQAASLERLHELGRGIVVLALDDAIARRLALPRQAPGTQMRLDLPFTAPIDAARGVGGGWSLNDRARTMRVAADPASGPADVQIPGHVHPVRLDRAHLLEGRGQVAAAALELTRMIAAAPAVALCLVVDRSGAIASLGDARRDADLGRLPLVSADSMRTLARAEQASELAISCEMPIRDGPFEATIHAPAMGGDAIVALVHGDPAGRERPLVYAHAGCLFGDTFGSLRCCCHAELEAALAAVVAEGAGIVLYSKLAPTDAPAICGRERSFDGSIAAGLLRRIGVAALRLSGHDTALAPKLQALGLDVETFGPRVSAQRSGLGSRT